MTVNWLMGRVVHLSITKTIEFMFVGINVLWA